MCHRESDFSKFFGFPVTVKFHPCSKLHLKKDFYPEDARKKPRKIKNLAFTEMGEHVIEKYLWAIFKGISK